MTTTKPKIHSIFHVLVIMSLTMATDTSSSQSFFTKLEKRIEEVDSHLCIGLDPHLKELFPEIKNDTKALSLKTEHERCDAAFTFCKNLIDATGEC